MTRSIAWWLLGATLVACSSGSSSAPPDETDGATTDGASTDDTGVPATDGAPTKDSAGPTSDATGDTPASDGPLSSGAFDGYWVWKEIVEGGTVTRTITDADMAWKVGPSGWPGCPAGISCTRYGIEVLYVNATRLHFMQRVTTGSDYQKYGAYTIAGDLVTIAQEQAFSCAHPKAKTEYPKPATLYARFKRTGDDLWITPFADKDPGAAASKWTVYRSITKLDAHNKYDHPFCGSAREGGECHCLCPSQDVLADYGCGTK